MMKPILLFKSSMLKMLVLLCLFCLNSASAQLTKTEIVQGVSKYRDHVIKNYVGHSVELIGHLERLDEFGFSAQLKRDLYKDSWKFHSEKSTYKDINRRIYKRILKKKNEQGEQISIEELELMLKSFRENKIVLNMVVSEVLLPEPPFKINSESNVFEEIEFYDFGKDDKITELGSYNGEFIFLLQSMLPEAHFTLLGSGFPLYKANIENDHSGLWIDTSNLRLIHRSLFQKEKGGLRWNLEKSSMDKIIFRNNLVHMSYQKKILQGVHESLKDDGWLIIKQVFYLAEGIRSELEPRHQKLLKDILKAGFELDKEMIISPYHYLVYKKAKQ